MHLRQSAVSCTRIANAGLSLSELLPSRRPPPPVVSLSRCLGAMCPAPQQRRRTTKHNCTPAKMHAELIGRPRALLDVNNVAPVSIAAPARRSLPSPRLLLGRPGSADAYDAAGVDQSTREMLFRVWLFLIGRSYHHQLFVSIISVPCLTESPFYRCAIFTTIMLISPNVQFKKKTTFSALVVYSLL